MLLLPFSAALVSALVTTFASASHEQVSFRIDSEWTLWLIPSCYSFGEVSSAATSYPNGALCLPRSEWTRSYNLVKLRDKYF